MTVTGTFSRIMDIVKEALANLATGEQPLLLVFWAGRGGGKTTLLNLFRDRFAGIENVVPLGPWDVHAVAPDALSSEVLLAIRQAPPHSRKLLLLDNLDELLRTDDGEPFFALERQVLRELIGRGDTLIVATSRVPLIQWREYDVRVATRNDHIPSLSREDVAGWARARGLDPERAFALSLGYPQVLAWLEAQPDLSPEEVDHRVAVLFLDGLSEKARPLAEVASLFPAFDLAVLRSLLGAGQEDESFYGEYVERLEELMRAGLVAWAGEVGAYRFRDGTVRRLLARALLRRDPDRFREIHKIAAEYYQREAGRAAYLHRVLVSAFYHTAQAYRADGAQAAGDACIRWVEETIGQWLEAPWEKVLEAWRTGAWDEATREELRELIGAEVFAHITRRLESAAEAAYSILQTEVTR